MALFSSTRPLRKKAFVLLGLSFNPLVLFANFAFADPEQVVPEMVVKVDAKRRLIQTRGSVSSSSVTQSEIAKMPQGQEIPLPKLITNTTPGVVQGPFGQMFFRGNHANVLYQLDGVQMPESPSNSFGQAVSPRNIDRMDVITGGLTSEYGQRLSAVVNIVTKSGPEKPGAELELNYGSYNAVSPHLLIGGSNDSGSFRYFFSFNGSRTDRGLDTPQPELESNQSQGGAESIHNNASGDSEFGKVEWLPDNNNRVLLIVSHSQSSFQIPNFPTSFGPTNALFSPGFQDKFGNTSAADEPLYNYVPYNTDDSQSETNAYAQVVWKHTFTDRSFLQVSPYFKYSLINVKNDPQNDLFFKSIYPNLNLTSFKMNRATNNLGLKADYTIRADERNLIKTGILLQASRASGEASFQTNLNQSPFLDSSPNLGYFESAYVQDELSIGKSVVVSAGLRFDATQFLVGGSTSSDFMFQPRLGLSYLPTETTKAHLYYGKLFQPAPVESLRVQFNNSNGSIIPLQTYDLKAEKDDYFETGISKQVFGTHVATFNLYYKNGINILDDDQLLNTSIAQPYNYAVGYAYGAELSLKGQITEDWSDFFNYSYGIAKGEGRSGGILNDADILTGYQFLDHVQLHSANAGIAYTKNQFWWSLMGLFGSGLRTGPSNSIGLPAHLTFDTSVGVEFLNGISWLPKSKVSLDVLNILDTRYPITIANGFNGSHYAAGRLFYIRFSVSM